MAETENATPAAPETAAPAAPAVRTIAGGGIDLEPARGAISLGAMTPEEAAAHWRLTPDEARELGARGPAKSSGAKAEPSIDDQLADIRALRKTDPKAYWSDEMQNKQLGLIRAQEMRVSAAGTLVGEATKPLEQIEKELKQIDQVRRTDRRAYDKDPAMQERELKLLGEKEAAITEGKTLEGLHAIVDPVLETAADREAFEGSFNAMYEAMPESAQDAMRAVLGGDVIEPSRPASEAQVETFAGSDIGGDLVKEWGRSAPAKLAMVQASVNQMILRGGDVGAALEWFDSLPAAQAKAIIRGLAR